MFLALQNLHFLDQATSLLEALDDRQFTSQDCHGHSSTGAHMRHVLDAYRCFLAGLEDGRINYDARQRDARVETDRATAAQRVKEVRSHLESLTEADRSALVKVKADAAAWGELNAWTDSTIGRELQFLLSHTVHHFALIAMTLRSLDFEPGPGFGVAPSTLEHQTTGLTEKSQAADSVEAVVCAR